MMGRFLCWIGLHSWSVGSDEFGVARWCERCDCKQVFRVGGVTRGPRGLVPVRCRWESDDE